MAKIAIVTGGAGFTPTPVTFKHNLMFFILSQPIIKFLI